MEHHYSSKQTLARIHDRIPVTIDHVDNTDLKSRLYEIGLYPGQTLEVIRRAPFGDPLVIQVDGQLVMLRLNEAELITVYKKEST